MSLYIAPRGTAVFGQTSAVEFSLLLYEQRFVRRRGSYRQPGTAGGGLVEGIFEYPAAGDPRGPAGGFDAVRHFTELDELVIYDSPSLKSLEFLQGAEGAGKSSVDTLPRPCGYGVDRCTQTETGSTAGQLLTDLEGGRWVLASDGIDRGIWNRTSSYTETGLEWDTPRTSSTPGMLYMAIPGLHGRVDKNHTCYYGVPDYRFETTPLTLKDLEEFAIRFREEQDNGEGQDK